jgi:superoxide dismutase
MNFWINEHDVGYPVGSTPLLIMDVFEHALMLDYGLKRAVYIDVFFCKHRLECGRIQAGLKIFITIKTK